MCTNILECVEGSGKGCAGFPRAQASVTYDHPQHPYVEHAVNIDFVDRSGGLDGRVGVEAHARSARRLAGTPALAGPRPRSSARLAARWPVAEALTVLLQPRSRGH